MRARLAVELQHGERAELGNGQRRAEQRLEALREQRIGEPALCVLEAPGERRALVVGGWVTAPTLSVGTGTIPRCFALRSRNRDADVVSHPTWNPGGSVSRLARLSLANRALVALATVAIAIFGVISMGSLKQELIPSLQIPTAAVVGAYPGSAPAIVEQQVTVPVETAARGVKGSRTSRRRRRPGSP